MFPNFKIDELSQQLIELIPGSTAEIKAEIQQNIKLVLQGALAKLDVVSREEFDVQTQVLAKTRQKIDLLEKQVFALMKEK